MRRLLSVLAFAGLVAFQVLSVNTAHAADSDGDKVADAVDVCPEIADPFQGDVDSNGVGDLCETDTGTEGTAANDLIVGTSSADTLNGGGGNDALYGLEGDDTLEGGSGNDFLAGGPGTDTMTGGASCDVFAFDPAGDGDVITDFDPAVDRVTFPAQDDNPADDPAPAATFGGEDHLVVTFDTDATLDFQGLAPGVTIQLSNQPCASAPPVDDQIPVPEEPPFICAPLFDFEIFPPDFLGIELPADGIELIGTSANESLNGTHCSDIIVGDTEVTITNPDDPGPEPAPHPGCVAGLCGDDVIYGLAGNDLLVGDTDILGAGETGGNDTIYGGEGDDLIFGDAGVLDGCDCGGVGIVGGIILGPIGGNDYLFGNEGNDVIFGDAIGGLNTDALGGDDYIDGGTGDDVLVGDALFIGDGSTGGSDTLIGGDGDDIIYGDAMDVDASSTAGNDTLIGGAGDDYLVGDAESVNGLGGADQLVFDADTNFGNDTIIGIGQGGVADTIVIAGSGINTLTELENRSTVTDDGTDILATIFTDTAKTTQTGSMLLIGMAIGGVTAWSALVAYVNVAFI